MTLDSGANYKIGRVRGKLHIIFKVQVEQDSGFMQVKIHLARVFTGRLDTEDVSHMITPELQ